MLKAASQVGDIKTALEVVDLMNQNDEPFTPYIYNGLIRVYAGACAIKGIKEEHMDMYVEDVLNLID